MKSILFVLLLPAFSLPAAAAPAAKKEEQVKKSHDNLFTTLNHLTVEFDQTIYTSLRSKTRTRSGTAFFSKPGSFVWRFFDNSKPEEEYYFDSKTLSHYIAPEKTVTHYGTRSGLQLELQAIVNLILDAKLLLRNYDATNIQETKGVTSMQLIPKDPKKSDVRKIEVSIEDAKKYVQKVKIEYTNGNYSTFLFKNPKSDPIPLEKFRFVNPGGVKENTVG